jgi:hypothetical protein
MEKHPPTDDFAAYFRGLLEASDAKALEEHVSACAACAAKLRDEARVELAMYEARQPPAVGDAAQVAVESDAARARPRPARSWHRPALLAGALAAAVALVWARSHRERPANSTPSACVDGPACGPDPGKETTMTKQTVSAALLALLPVAPAFACSGAAPADPTHAVAHVASPDIEPGPLPQAWFAAGAEKDAYVMGTDASVVRGGRAALTLQSKRATPSFGTIMTRTVDLAAYRGKRIRLRGAVRSEDVRGWAGLWLRVDRDEKLGIAFDNMQDRPICGTTDWRAYDVVLDVTPEATRLSYGVLLSGEGRLWADDLRLEVVDASVATTALAPSVEGPGGPGLAPSWNIAGSRPDQYDMTADASVRRGQGPSLTVRAMEPTGDDFGTLMQSVSAPPFGGKRARFSAAVRVRDVVGWAGLWLRVDGADGKRLAFDNMQNRPIVGTSDWKTYDVVLDVPVAADRIALGVLLVGKGQVWMDSVSLTAE